MNVSLLKGRASARWPRGRATHVLATLMLSIILVMTGFATTGTAATPAPSRTTAEAPAAATKVKVKIRAASCKNCKITVVHVKEDWTLWQQARRVRDGRAVFSVPRPYTRELRVVVDSPKRTVLGDGAAIRYAALRYRGRKPGQHVSASVAEKSRYGYVCWRGTSATSATMKLRVDAFRAKDAYTGARGWEVRAYLVKGASVTGSAARTWRGALGAQDWAYC